MPTNKDLYEKTSYILNDDGPMYFEGSFRIRKPGVGELGFSFDPERAVLKMTAVMVDGKVREAEVPMARVRY